MNEKAINFGSKKHEGQFRRFNNEPYFVHPTKVADLVKQFTDDQNIIDAAYLHDTLEDTNASFDELVREFGLEVANLVKELTSNDDEIAKVGKAQYLLNKMNHMSSDALLVKLADRCDNTSGFAEYRELLKDDTKNLEKLNKFIRRYSEETKYILDNLTANLTINHKIIIEKIRENIAKYA
jgi:(p)ppGpp synthase/HD superfamily hydrolase